MASQTGRLKRQVPQESKMKGRDDVLEMRMPPGFTNKPSMKSDLYGALGTSNPRNGGPSVSSSDSSSAFSSTVPDVGSFFGASNSSLYSRKDDFDSFLDDAPPDIGAPSTGIAVAVRNEVKRAAPTGAKTVGLFLPYLPHDDAVAAGLGAKDGGIDASEAQEVVDHLNQQLASLLRCSPSEFWKKVAMDETLDTFIDSYLHFRRRWYDDTAFATSRKQTAGVIVGDGDLSRRVFMLLYRMSSNHDPGVPSRRSLSAKEHAALLKDWKLLDLPKLLDICAVYDHDNHELTSRLVSNVFKAQPSFASDLAAIVTPILGKIDTMHQRCCTMIHSLQESEVDAVKEQLTEVVEYLNDVIITLDSFVGSYPSAAFILISAGATRDGIGMFLPALCAIYEYMLLELSTGFTALSNPLHPISSTESLEVAGINQVKRLKSGIVRLAWKILQACFLQKEEEGIAQFGDFPSLGGAAEVIKTVQNPESKGALLVQAAIAMTQVLGERDVEGAPTSFVACNPGKHLGALLRVIEKQQGLCEVVHERCQSGSLIMDDAQYDYFLSLVSRREAPQLSNEHESFKNEYKIQDETAAMLQSNISQVKDLFPDYGDGFVALCLEAYDNDPEKVISCILEDKLHPDLASLNVKLALKPSRKVEPSTDKGKGKAIEEPGVEHKGKGVVGYDAGGSATSVGREETSSGKQPSAFATTGGVSKAEAANVNQGSYIRRGKQDGPTFNQLIDRRENMSYSATVRAGKQYEYEDEYDDSFDDLAGTYMADVDEEETENLADKTRRQSASGNSNDDVVNRRSGGKANLTKGGLHQLVFQGADQSSDSRNNRQHDAPKASGSGGLNPPELNSSGHGSRTGQLSGRGGHQSTGPFMEARKLNSGAPEGNSSARVDPSPHASAEETVSTAAGASLDGGKTPPSQGGSAAARGGKSQRGKGKGKADPTANFYLKDGKLYSYKVAGAEASFATVEEYEASQIAEEDTIFRLGAGGNIPAAIGEERESPGNMGTQVPGGRGTSMRGRGGLGRGRYASKSNDNHRRKDQSMKKHFAGLSGL